MSQHLTRIAVICDCPLLQYGISQVIETAPDLERVDPVRCFDKQQYEVGPADVIVLNLQSPAEKRCDLIARFNESGKSVVVLSLCAAQTELISAIESGAKGYVSLQVEESEFLAALRTVASGGSYFSIRSDGRDSDKRRRQRMNITERERQILELVAMGATDREIACKLNISEHTVHSHLDRLRRKTGSRRRAELTRLALREETGGL